MKTRTKELFMADNNSTIKIRITLTNANAGLTREEMCTVVDVAVRKIVAMAPELPFSDFGAETLKVR
jgi:hypothetical protein